MSKDEIRTVEDVITEKTGEIVDPYRQIEQRRRELQQMAAEDRAEREKRGYR